MRCADSDIVQLSNYGCPCRPRYDMRRLRAMAGWSNRTEGSWIEWNSYFHCTRLVLQQIFDDLVSLLAAVELHDNVLVNSLALPLKFRQRSKNHPRNFVQSLAVRRDKFQAMCGAVASVLDVVVIVSVLFNSMQALYILL